MSTKLSTDQREFLENVLGINPDILENKTLSVSDIFKKAGISFKTVGQYTKTGDNLLTENSPMHFFLRGNKS